jgi:hypothetical protein
MGTFNKLNTFLLYRDSQDQDCILMGTDWIRMTHLLMGVDQQCLASHAAVNPDPV